MIAQLHGRLIKKSPTSVLLDVNGVGYELSIPLSTFEKIGQVGESATLLTHLNVREDALQLFGFASSGEKKLFQQLISVSGVGPKVAQGILSGCTVEMFCQYIQRNEIASLTAIPGIGKKTAERLVIELRDRIKQFVSTEEKSDSFEAATTVSEEALLALVSLGYPRVSAEKAIRRVTEENGELSLEDLIKRSLRHI